MNFKKFFSIILITIFVQSFSKKIIFPFKTKTYPFDPEKEFKYILKNEIYTTLYVGTPSQKVELYLTTRTPFFIIKKNETFENYFKSDASSTYVPHNENNTFYLSDEVLKHGIHSSEKIYLQNSFEEQSLSQIDNLDFIYCTQYKKDSKYHQGILGLQYFSTYYVYPREINIMVLLKKRGLTSNYVWNLNYTSDDSGYLVIGEYPHTYDEKNYNKENIRYANLYNKSNYEYILNFDDIYITLNNQNFYLEKNKIASFYIEEFFIFGTNEYFEQIEYLFFKKYINEQICHKKVHKYKNIMYYFICYINDNKVREIFFNNFPSLTFYQKQMNYNFTLDSKDLFTIIPDNNRILFNIGFINNSKIWILGKPFFKKYQISFNIKSNKIIYYSNSSLNVKEIKNNEISKKLYFIIFFVFISGFLLGKIICFKYNRKIRANELEDNYSYLSNNTNNINN